MNIPQIEIWVINGPNLNLIGEREPEIYGSDTLKDVEKRLFDKAKKEGICLQFFQENEEGKLVALLHQARKKASGILINPGAYSHYSLAIYDALRAIGIPKVEIHISQVLAREEIRKNLLTASACDGLIAGFGTSGYLLGFSALVDLVRGGL